MSDDDVVVVGTDIETETVRETDTATDGVTGTTTGTGTNTDTGMTVTIDDESVRTKTTKTVTKGSELTMARVIGATLRRKGLTTPILVQKCGKTFFTSLSFQLNTSAAESPLHMMLRRKSTTQMNREKMTPRLGPSLYLSWLPA